jgi:tetratricopeptide (TPR) repeat protein
MATRLEIDRSRLPLYTSLLFAVGCLMLSVLGNEDLWWYLASGDEIIARRGIPESDPFLFTSGARDTWVTTSREQATWVNHSWLWTVLLAGLHRGFGPDGLAVFAALAVGSLVTLLFTQGRLDRFGLVNALVTMGVLYTCIDRLALRAELAGWLLFTAYAVLLEGRPPFGRRRFALLAALQWLWANLHGSYVLGLGLAFAYSIGGFAQRRLATATGGTGGPPPEPRATVPLWLGPALCVVSVAMPRLGRERVLDALAFLRQLVASSAGSYATPIEEWQGTWSAGFGPWAATHLTIAAIGVLGFAAARPPRSLSRGLVFVGMGLLAVPAVRFIAGFAIATGLVTLWNLSELRPSLQRRIREFGTRTVAFQWAATCLLCALLVAIGATRLASRGALEVGQSTDSLVTLHPQFTCPGAARYLRETGLTGPIFNDVGFGGYLIHALFPEHQLYVDTRNLSAAVIQDYRKALRNPNDWRELDRRYGFGIVILGNARVAGLPLRSELAADPNWELVYFDPQAAVFAKKVGVLPPARFAPKGGASGVPYLLERTDGWRSWLPAWGAPLLARYLDALFELRRPGDAAAIASDALDLDPEGLYWLQARALGRLRSGQARLAVGDYARVTERMPRNADAHFRYALALHRSGADARALEVLGRLAKIDPGHREARQLRRKIETAGSGDGAG